MITTEKDTARIRFFSSPPLPLWTLAVGHEFRGMTVPFLPNFFFAGWNWSHERKGKGPSPVSG